MIRWKLSHKRSRQHMDMEEYKITLLDRLLLLFLWPRKRKSSIIKRSRRWIFWYERKNAFDSWCVVDTMFFPEDGPDSPSYGVKLPASKVFFVYGPMSEAKAEKFAKQARIGRSKRTVYSVQKLHEPV